MSTRTTEQPTRGKTATTWPFILLATALGVIWAVISTTGALEGLPRPDGTPLGATYAMAGVFTYATLSALLATAIAWLVIHFALLRKPRSPGKSFLGFLGSFLASSVLACALFFVVLFS